jgi:phage-related protein (TIGR01555 family)
MSEELVNLGHNGDESLRVDGLVNALTGMGGRRDKSQYTTSTPIVFLSQEELENLYSEWIPKRIVDIVAEQSTRKGFKVLFGGEGAAAEEVSGIEQVIEDLYILENLGLASKNARLFGGSVILLYIDDGRSAEQPVDYRNIRSIEGMEVLDRWQIAPVINEDALYDYSKATHYQIISGDLIRQPQLTKIHKDRILRLDGEWLPYRIRQRNYGWGMSTLQSAYDSFRFYSTGISSAATLLTEFDIFVHKLRGLSSMLAAGKEKDVRDRLVLNDMSKSIYRGYAIDAEKEELEFISRNFGGVGEILEKLRIDIIGASQIPHTILFGESPGGLGSTGRSEERDFAKHLGDYQASHYKRPLQQLMKMIMLSKDGPTEGRLPESWRIKFNDLFELNEREEHEQGEEKEDAEFKDKALHQQAIAAAKSKFKVWPSAVAGAYVTQKYKQLYKSKHGSMEGAFKGKKTTAEYFKKQDAIEPMKVEGLMLAGVDEAAFISDEDIENAMKQWKEEAPAQFKELLEADNAE